MIHPSPDFEHTELFFVLLQEVNTFYMGWYQRTLCYVIIVLSGVVFSCESEKIFPPKGYLPANSESTEMLEAPYFWIAQDNLDAAYWKEANYIDVPLSDVSIMQSYPDGYLNMEGTYNGLSDFNLGKNPFLTIKAGYDSAHIYILVEWKDTLVNASSKLWKWDGPEDPLKNDTINGWTNQGNSDKLTLLFDNTTNTDVWKWDMALTAPFDMAQNLTASSDGNITEDSSLFSVNSVDNEPRTGPEFEWNGVRQEIVLADGTKKLLDPGYYLLNEFKTEIPGDIAAGKNVFNVKADCRFCHGYNGDGDADGFTNGGSLQGIFINRYTREGLVEFISSSAHEGAGNQYWGRIKNNPEDILNLVTFLRGIAGLPGFVLIPPAMQPDIKALSNIGTGSIGKYGDTYQVLFIRELDTEYPEDITFNPSQEYTFSIRLSDNDELNYIGASNLKLIFKSNQL